MNRLRDLARYRLHALIASTLVMSLVFAAAPAQTRASPIGQMQRISATPQLPAFEIDRTEVTIGQFAQFAQATKIVTLAEKNGGGSEFAGGWQQRKGWTWRTPFGVAAAPDEPAVHVTYDEAQAYCRWAGKQLPTDAQWERAAYVETREQSAIQAAGQSLQNGQRYDYPTGTRTIGAQCAQDCGPVKNAPSLAGKFSAGHALAGTTAQGVNGLHEMGGNAWEWVDSGAGAQKRTRGGSWWYGNSQMHRDYVQTKSTDTAVVYIGFRCARSV